jgi:hypothetical protein
MNEELRKKRIFFGNRFRAGQAASDLVVGEDVEVRED